MATDDEAYHFYETIPDVPREYEVPIKDSECHNDESKQENHDVEGSGDYCAIDGDIYYNVNDPTKSNQSPLVCYEEH